MLEINAAFGQEGQNLGLVGRTGENASRRIVFDCEAVLGEFPEAGIVCALRRACDAEAYAKELTAEGKKRLLTLSAADVAAPGSLMIELRAVEADAIRKSAVYVGRIERGLSGQGDAPGNPVADTINNLEARAKEASAAAAAAQAVADEVQAKLEAGEFKGDKGDKGDPGSDAEVTAENIQSALGYAPVTPSALAAKQDALTDADRQSITKTGMTTGAAWTENEQKAARERMGIDKAYELIESITTDGTAIVEREAEPNGTPYNFSHAILAITSPKNMKSSSIVFCYMSTMDASISSYVMFEEKVAYFKRAMFLADVVNGILSYKSTDSMISYSDQQDQGSTDTGNLKQSPTLYFTSNNIKKIRVYNMDNSVISAGFLIQIYGVRA